MTQRGVLQINLIIKQLNKIMKKLKLKLPVIIIVFAFSSLCFAEKVCTTSTNPDNNKGKCIKMWYGISCKIDSFVHGEPDPPSCSAAISIE